MLDTLGYGRVDMLGYSWGGALAQQFAFQNPRRCRRLVLAATATGALMVPARPAVLAKMLTPRRFVDRDYLASIAATTWTSSVRVTVVAISIPNSTFLIPNFKGLHYPRRVLRRAIQRGRLERRRVAAVDDHDLADAVASACSQARSFAIIPAVAVPLADEPLDGGRVEHRRPSRRHRRARRPSCRR